MFNSTTFVAIDEKTFNEQKYFSEYHYFEKYDETKKYNNSKFQMDFGKGIHTYENELMVMRNPNNANEIKYVVASEVLAKDERAILADYCPCAYCNAILFKKISMDPCYEGCLKYGHHYTPQKHIDEARKKLNTSNNSLWGNIKSYISGDLKK